LLGEVLGGIIGLSLGDTVRFVGACEAFQSSGDTIVRFAADTLGEKLDGGIDGGSATVGDIVRFVGASELFRSLGDTLGERLGGTDDVPATLGDSSSRNNNSACHMTTAFCPRNLL